VEDPHDTFYGIREFIIRDINGFWVAFGQPYRGVKSSPSVPSAAVHPAIPKDVFAATDLFLRVPLNISYPPIFAGAFGPPPRTPIQ
jgi:hypothetical protein